MPICNCCVVFNLIFENRKSIVMNSEKNVGKVVLRMTISLDGFAEDSNGSVGNLYPDLDILRESQVLRESIRDTGAVVMAWKEYAMAEDPDWFAGNYEYQVPIFVLTDQLPKTHPKETGTLTFTFVVDGMISAIQKAKAAAGGKNVTIIGSARTSVQSIQTGLVDELHMDIIPIFLKTGFRPFDNIGNTSIKVERIMVAELPAGRTHLRFQIIPDKSK